MVSIRSRVTVLERIRPSSTHSSPLSDALSRAWVMAVSTEVRSTVSFSIRMG